MAEVDTAQATTVPTLGDDENAIWLVIGPNVWGKGFTRDQAFDAAGREARAHYIVFRVTDAWAYVDDMGYIVHARDAKVIEVEKRAPKRRK